MMMMIMITLHKIVAIGLRTKTEDTEGGLPTKRTINQSIIFYLPTWRVAYNKL